SWENFNRLMNECAQALMDKAKAAGQEAYRGADYDLAMATNLFGQVLFDAGQTATALGFFFESHQLFVSLEKQGKRLASVTLARQADCLTDLGLLDEAAELYSEAIKQTEEQENFRSMAVNKGQLATVHLLQEQYSKALVEYEEALIVFEGLNEPASLTAVWHQVSITYQKDGQYEQSEVASRRALEISTINYDLAGQARSLVQLGNLYDDCLHRQEEAIVFYRQSADIHIQLSDFRSEGIARNNLAETLLKLKRYDEARSEILRAIECKYRLDNTVNIWISLNILHDIEAAMGNHPVADAAWKQARDAYLAYRRQGGNAQTAGGSLAEHILTFAAQEKWEEIELQLKELSGAAQIPASGKHMIQTLNI
ncbi:MAG: tetratricopeptide repeat protein, partial [Candidatus Electrothrix sp. AR3]|nr:tetratricopeptide repeat protein [Candidatus Electrothrix sp. AR3]